MKILSRLLACSALAVFGACSQAADEPEAAPSAAAATEATPTASVVGEAASAGAEYAKVKDLVADMAANGVSCEDVNILDAPQESIADFGLCFIDGEKEYETDIYLFDDEQSRDDWHSSFAEYPDIHTLLGANWFITSGSVEELERIQGAIGGEIDPQAGV